MKTKELQKISEELLALMGTKAKVEVSYDKEQKCYMVNVDGGEETGLLIGKKGETLLSLQTILGILLKQQTGEWERVTVNVGDYLEKEEEYLKSLAVGAATRAKETKEPTKGIAGWFGKKEKVPDQPKEQIPEVQENLEFSKVASNVFNDDKEFADLLVSFNKRFDELIKTNDAAYADEKIVLEDIYDNLIKLNVVLNQFYKLENKSNIQEALKDIKDKIRPVLVNFMKEQNYEPKLIS